MTTRRISVGGPLGLVLAAALAVVSAGCGQSDEPVEIRPEALISDQGHNNGHSGFIWIAPTVPTTPSGFTTLDQTGGSATLTINIDQILASDLNTVSKATITGTGITMVTGSSNSNFPGATGPFYGANWAPGNTVASGQTYRVSVQVLSNPARVLGFVDVQVVANQTAANAVDRTKFTPLIVGGTLPIVFRLEAKDTDGDTLNDWRDNCVFTKNINQVDSDTDRVGDACQCLGVPNGTPCDNPCKLGQTCTNGVCGGGSNKTDGAVCSTGNLCKQTEICTNGVCGGGSNKTNGTTCATGNPCKQNETCTNGTCGGGSNRSGGTSCKTGNPCKQNETCTSGTCGGGSNRSAGTACSTTNNPCTSGQTCSSGGNCNGTATNRPNGTACGDDRFCTLGDTCQAGLCAGTAVACTTDSCHAVVQCTKIGLCSGRRPDGFACNDNNACTNPDTCLAGACQAGAAVTCTASDTCHTIGACVPATGCPAQVTKADDSPCNDGNACTLFDTCRFGQCMAVQTACPATPVRVRSRSNSWIRMPYGLSEFADIDGDGIAEVLTTTGNRLFANRAQQAAGGIGHHYFDQNVLQLVVGHFSGAAGQDVCAMLEGGRFECLAWAGANLGFQVWSSATTSGVSPWIQVPVFGQEGVMVGDFDHDGRDDLLLYAAQTRSFRFLTAKAGLGCDPTLGCGPVFTTMANIDANSLNNFASGHFDLSFKQLYVGAFLGSEQDDLLFLDHNTGEVYVFDGRYTTSGTFVLTFAAPPNEIQVSSSPALDSTIAVANVDGSSRDSIVTYISGSGSIRFLQVPSTGTHLTDVPMLPAQLPGAASEGSRMFFAKTSNWGEQGSAVREDAYFYNAGVQQFSRSDARFSGGNTYWWAYSQNIRRFDFEFPPMTSQQLWLVLMCTDADVPAQSWFTTPIYSWLYGKSGRNTPNMYNFFKDMSYGTANYASEVHGTWGMAAPQNTRGRDLVWNECFMLSGTPSNWFDFFYRVVVISNGVDDFGAGSATRVTLDNRSSTEIYTPAQEMGHRITNFPHAFGAAYPNGCGGSSDPGEYCDATDPMGGGLGGPYQYFWGVTPIQSNGTGFNVSAGYGAATRFIAGWVPDARQISLSTGATRTTQTITLAGLDRPESPGYLLAAVQPTSDSQNSYLIEYRSKTGRWDTALPSEGIVIRHFIFNNNWGQRVGYVEGDGLTTSLMQAGATFSEAGMTVRVVSMDSVSGTAAVEITY